MLNKILLAVTTLFVAMNFAMAQVDANHADQAALDGIKGLGPTTSKTIIAERNKNGKFKDWSDFENRVKGIGEKKSVRLSQSGLMVNGRSKPGTATAPLKTFAPQPLPPGNRSAVFSNSRPTPLQSGF